MLYIDFKISGVDVLCDREKIPEGNDIGIRTTFSEDWASLDKYVTYRKRTVGGFSTGELKITSNAIDTTDVFYGADFVEIGFIGRDSERVLMSSHVIGVKLEKGAYIFDAGVKADDLSLSKAVSDLRSDVDGLDAEMELLGEHVDKLHEESLKYTDDHKTDFNNPHRVTAEQTGALSTQDGEKMTERIEALEVPAGVTTGDISLQQLYDGGKITTDIKGTITIEGNSMTFRPENNLESEAVIEIEYTGEVELTANTGLGAMILFVDGERVEEAQEVRYSGGVRSKIAFLIREHTGYFVAFSVFKGVAGYTGGILSPELAEKLYKTSIFTQEEKAKVGKIDNLREEISQLKEGTGNIDLALEAILAIQKELIGGVSV